MSLYHEAAQILESIRKNGGLIKSTVFTKKTWKSDPKALFALSTEASKWSQILSEVIEHSGVLKIEKQLTPTTALLLVHDLLLAKKGIALPRTHGLSTAISRHKARLTAEFTKCRLGRGLTSVDALRDHINGKAASGKGVEATTQTESLHPRWIRINTLRTSLEEQMRSTFADFASTTSLLDIADRGGRAKLLYVDENVPNLIAIPPHLDIVAKNAYKQGKLILQDKASCFPALLLQPGSIDGDIIDTCAAPGNKTTHLAALIASMQPENGRMFTDRTIFACERDALRSQTLTKMVELAGAEERVHVKAQQDFLRLEPESKEFANVTGLLLDPSCSGSGIIGRDETTVEIHLPDPLKVDDRTSRGKKRKRNNDKVQDQSNTVSAVTTEIEELPTQLPAVDSKLQDRLTALSTFQLRLLQHAMAFPAAKRVTYSTCSLYDQENEYVVVKALLSDIAKNKGWRILRREDQIPGLREWKKRGNSNAVLKVLDDIGTSNGKLDPEVISHACIRCKKNGEDGTMGFFVAGFVRDAVNSTTIAKLSKGTSHVSMGEKTAIHSPKHDGDNDDDDEEEWDGFSDDNT